MRVVRSLIFGILVLLARNGTAQAQTWQPVAHQPGFNAQVPVLLTDGTVLVQNFDSSLWYRLSPDALGDYVNGTWTPVASSPAGYGPLNHVSAVLADGRVAVIGGKYNLGLYSMTNQGAIYSPFTNTWTTLSPPSGWSEIGNVTSTILPSGLLLIGNWFDTRVAALNPANLIWDTNYGIGKIDSSAQENWVLLRDGSVLAVNAQNGTQSEKFVVSLGRWVTAGSTIVTLPSNGGLSIVPELGPNVLMTDGNVFATGGTSHTAIYTPPTNPVNPGTWVAGPDFPSIPGQGPLHVFSGPAALLPNGKVLVSANPLPAYDGPAHFFEFDGATLTEVAAPPNSAFEGSHEGHLLLLPNGQVLFTDGSGDVQIYTPTGGPSPSWKPTITSVPATIQNGATYQISGTQFNGLSQGSFFGNDAQSATNYPIVRITNRATGHVFYARTHDHSTMGVATGTATVSTYFDTPVLMESGLSDVEVVANGIASAKSAVTVSLYNIPSGIVSPSPGSMLSTTATFSWTAGSGNSQIWVDIGNVPGGTSYYSGSQGTQTYTGTVPFTLSRTVSGLPTNGAPVYVRLWSEYNHIWYYTDYTYSSPSPVPAGMVSPAPGTTFGGSSATFTWTAGNFVSQIWLDVGTTIGGTNIYSATQGTALSRTVSGLPVNGAHVYVRLWSLTSLGWSYTDYTYTAATPTPAAMIGPVPGATFPGAAVTFNWSSGVGITQIWLDVGTSPGGSNLYGASQGLGTSRTVSGLPVNGAPVYVRLWSLDSSSWRFNDYTYTASTTSIANMSSPANGSTLGGATTFMWTNPGVSQIWLDVGTTVGGSNIYSATQGTGTTRTVAGLPTNGAPVYVRLWSLASGAWRWIDYSYTSASYATLTSPAPGSTLSGSSRTFMWTAGSGVTQIWLDVGTTMGGSQIYGASQGLGTSRLVTGIPTNGSTLYVRLWSLTSAGWFYTDYTFVTGP